MVPCTTGALEVGLRLWSIHHRLDLFAAVEADPVVGEYVAKGEYPDDLPLLRDEHPSHTLSVHQVDRLPEGLVVWNGHWRGTHFPPYRHQNLHYRCSDNTSHY